MTIKKIAIIGNSVALRKRPPGLFPDNHSYGEILEALLNKSKNDLFYVNNYSIHRTTIKDVLKNIDFFLREFPSYYIINLGVVEATTREIPYWFSEIKDHSINRFKISSYIFNLVHYYIFKKFRPFFVRLRRKSTWVSEKKFKLYYEELLKTIVKETNSKIIIIPINKGNERIEKQAPKSIKNYSDYNKILKILSVKYKCTYVDSDDLDSMNHYPDGIHYSFNGHKKIAEKIYELIK